MSKGFLSKAWAQATMQNINSMAGAAQQQQRQLGPSQLPQPTWTVADQQKLDKLQEKSISDLKKHRKEVFKNLPRETRSAIISALAINSFMQEYNKSTYDFAHKDLHDLLRKKEEYDLNQGYPSYGAVYDPYNGHDAIMINNNSGLQVQFNHHDESNPSYEELKAIHDDLEADRILLQGGDDEQD